MPGTFGEEIMPDPGLSVYIDYATIGLIITNIGLIARAVRNGKRNNIKPGEAKECRERGEKIAVLETKQTNLEKDIEEIKDDIKEIKRAVVK